MSEINNPEVSEAFFDTFGLGKEEWWIGGERLIDYLKFGFTFFSFPVFLGL